METAAVLAAFDEQMRRRPKAGPAERVEVDERVTRVVSRSGGWNGVVWSDLTEADADAVIAAQIRRFACGGLAWEWKQYSYDRPADLPGRLQAAGFVPDPAEAVLVAEIAGLALEPDPPAGVELVPVTGQGAADALVAVHDEVFGGSHDAIGRAVLQGLGMQPSPVAAVIAMAGGIPVSAGRVELPEESDFASIGAAARCRHGAGAEFSARWSPTGPRSLSNEATGTCTSMPPLKAGLSSSGWASRRSPKRRLTSTPLRRRPVSAEESRPAADRRPL